MSFPRMTRRTAMASTAMAAAGLMLAPSKAMDSPRRIEAGLKDLEARSGGRLGVAVLSVATGQVVGNRIDERFAMCSTMKTLAVAYTLARIDRGEERLAGELSSLSTIWLRPSRQPDLMSAPKACRLRRFAKLQSHSAIVQQPICC